MDLHKIFSEVEKIDPEINERMDTRRQAMKQFANIGKVVALSAIPIALGGMFKKAYGRTPADVLGVLNYALTLEYLEAEFYAQVVGNYGGLVPNATALGALTKIGSHETAHVNFLKSAITSSGGTPVDKPTFKFTNSKLGNVFASYDTILATAQALEDTGVRAYKGQATKLMENTTVLTVALQIHSIEARHAAHIRYMRRVKDSNAQLKPWITGKYNDIAGVDAVYAGEDNAVQATITITGLTDQVSVNAATESFDEPLTSEAVLDIAGAFL
jgi:hypothetical protein